MKRRSIAGVGGLGGRAVTVLLVLTSASACVSSAPAMPQATSDVGSQTPAAAIPLGSAAPDLLGPPPASISRTPWEQELSDLEADGSRSLDSALRLFSMAFGPLPDVPQPPSDPGVIYSGSVALRSVRAHWAELSPAQQAAVERYLEVPPDAEQHTVDPIATEAKPAAPSSGAFAKRSTGDVVGQSNILGQLDPFIASTRESVQYFRDKLAAHWGDYPGATVVYFSPEVAGGGSFTYFRVDFAGDPSNFQCHIFVNGEAASAPYDAVRVSVAHEVFYCGAVWKLRSMAAADVVPAWVWEGAAHYFAMSTTWAPFYNAFDKYWFEPRTPLFQREYDAIGFWSHIQYRFNNVYSAIQAALPEASSTERFAAAGAASDDFLNTWAPGLFHGRVEQLGRDWNTDGLNNPESTPAHTIQLLTDDVEILELGAYTNDLFVVETSADLLRFEFIGRARVADGKGIDTTLLASTVFCTRMGGCPPCPGDPSARQYPVLANNAALAVSGGLDGTQGTITGEKLPDCPSPAPTSCPDPNAPPDAGLQQPVAMVGSITVAQSCPTPEPDDDEFCKRYRAFLAWQLRYSGTDYELTQPWAAEIADQMAALRPYAPAQLVEHVNVYIIVYRIYATLPEPANVPAAGPDAVRLANAFMAMNAYCGISGPEDL